MIYELLVKLLGVGVAGLIQFLPFTIIYEKDNSSLNIQTILTSPITQEAKQLAENSVPFSIQYDWSLIVNEQRAYHQITKHELIYKESTWFIDGNPMKVPFDSIQQQIGTSAMLLPGLRFDSGDKIIVFIKAAILPDSSFTRSTRMRTDVLWNYYTPKRKEQLVYIRERFIPE